MKKHLALLSLLTAALIASPAASRAADTAVPAATDTKPAKPKNPDATPFHGKVVSVDVAASTITVGADKLTLTAQSKISKDGNKAKLADIAVGDAVAGSYKKADSGGLTVLSLRDGKKPGNGTKKKKAA
jgi:hypothetical protein